MVLTAIAHCTVCATEYPYRKSKQFCSNACKQQAYLSNKNGVPLLPSISRGTPGCDFSLSEFELYREMADNGMDLLPYCFFRRNLKGLPDTLQIVTYFDALLLGYSWWDYYQTHLQSSKAYQTFKEEFLGGRYTIGI